MAIIEHVLTFVEDTWNMEISETGRWSLLRVTLLE